ncbi:MAG TPA: ABC transporter permease [Streptosporangiaceae bacterium]
MRTPVVPLTVRRMGAYRLVLAAVAVATLITAALVTTLAAFAGQALSQAVHHQLANAPDTSITVSDGLSGSSDGSDTTLIRSGMESVFGRRGFALDSAVWSNQLRLPARYTTSGDVPLAQAASFSGVAAHATLLAGHWPTRPQPGQPLSVAVPAAVAALLHLSPGDTVPVRDQVTGQTLTLRVSGVFRALTRSGPDAAYWQLNLLPASGVTASGGFITYGPMVVDQAAFSGLLAANQGSWVTQPVAGNIQAGQVAAVSARVGTEIQSLRNAAGGMIVASGLPGVLSGLASNEVVARSLLAIAAVQLLLLAAIALAGTARLLATDREGESALLTARGGSRWQLTRLSIAEAVLLAVVAAVAGGLIGGRLAALLARSGPLSSAGLRLHAITWDVVAVTVATAAFAALITLIPAFRQVAPGAARVRSGRQAAVSQIARSGADLGLVVLAALAVWQLHRSLIVTPSASGTIGVDPVLVVAPALALIGGTVILLRLLPLATRAGDRLASRGNRLILSLASWEVSRHPVRQASVALLVVVSVATGTLALSEHQSWLRSTQDQASFTAGADVRVDTPGPVSISQAAAIATVPGVRHAMAVAPVSAGSGEVLAVDSSRAASTVLIRRDQTTLPAPALFQKITPAARAPGLVLPGHPAQVRLTLSLGPVSLHLGPAVAVVYLRDANGNAYQLTAGMFAADGRPHILTARLTGAGAGGAGAAFGPLRLTGVTVDYTLPIKNQGKLATLNVLDVGTQQRTSPGRTLGAWNAQVASGELTGLEYLNGVNGLIQLPEAVDWAAGPARSQQLSFNPGHGQAMPGRAGEAPSPVSGQITLLTGGMGAGPLPAIATSAFLHSSNTSVGADVQTAIDGVTVPVKIVASVTTFPTVTGTNGALIMDLGSLQDRLVSQSGSALPVSEWWLATPGAGVPPGLARRLPGGSAMTTRAGVQAALAGNPLSAVPQQALLAMAVAAALLAIAGFCVAIAANVRQRRPQTALLSALGVPRRAQAWQFCLEELMISLPATVVGLGLGALMSALLVPAVTLTSGATTPVPPALTEFSWPLAVPLALAVAVLPVLVAATSTLRQTDAAARLRITESV